MSAAAIWAILDCVYGAQPNTFVLTILLSNLLAIRAENKAVLIKHVLDASFSFLVRSA